MQIDIRSDIKQAERYLQGLRKDQIPFATAYALTQTAKKAQSNLEREMARVFNNPTPYTLRGVFVRPATKQRLYAQVKLKDETVKGVPAVRYLIWHITGGSRSHKSFELLLQRAGVMPQGWFAIPTKSAGFDPYGNVPRGTLNRILAQLRAQRDPLTNETAQSKARYVKRKRGSLPRYFAALPGRQKTKHLPPGIYERVSFAVGSSIRPVFLYTQSAPTYKKRFKFYEIISQTVRDDLVSNFERGFKVAEATARPI